MTSGVMKYVRRIYLFPGVKVQNDWLLAHEGVITYFFRVILCFRVAYLRSRIHPTPLGASQKSMSYVHKFLSVCNFLIESKIG